MGISITVRKTELGDLFDQKEISGYRCAFWLLLSPDEKQHLGVGPWSSGEVTTMGSPICSSSAGALKDPEQEAVNRVAAGGKD